MQSQRQLQQQQKEANAIIKPSARSRKHRACTPQLPSGSIWSWSCVAVAILCLGCQVGVPYALPPSGSPDRLDLTTVDDFYEADYIARLRPKSIEATPDGSVIFVGLEGNLIDAGHEVLAVGAGSGQIIRRIDVGSSPQGLVLSNDGKKLYVMCQFSNVISVIDVATLSNLSEIPVAFYAQDGVMSLDGQQLFITNRWLDAVQVVALDTPNGISGKVSATIPVGTNPRDIVLSEDGATLFVGSVAATSVSVVDVASERETERIHTNAPVNGLVRSGQLLYVATLGKGDGHPKTAGINEGTEYRGDTTESMGFADINNDVIVIDMATRQGIMRYTSDTAEVSHVDATGDFTPAEMIIEGALPEQAAVHGNRLAVSMSSSDQVQLFDIDPATGLLTAARTFDVGQNPWELTFSPDGTTIFTADRLGETVTRIDLATGTTTTFGVGVMTPPYPATEYEIGERFFHQAAIASEALPSDMFPQGTKAGDKSCAHCHRESMTDGKVWSVGVGSLLPVGGERIPPAARNIRDTQKLFWEGVQTDEDFDLEVNEFSPPEDFAGATEDQQHQARDAFFMRQVGYTFDQVARHLIGQYLIGRPRLMPNPMAQYPTQEQAAKIARGRALFESDEVKCAQCHPAPHFTTNLNLDPLITRPALDHNISFKVDLVDNTFNIPSIRGVWERPLILLHDGRAKSIASAILPPGHSYLQEGQDGCHLLGQMNTTIGAGLFRPVYNAGGCNEVNGTPDTHGTTSQLSNDEVDDLLTYVLSIE